jgi:oxygen-independent coproporphyrinogen-3 oxidase
VETYLAALSREIALYAGREGFGGRQFEFVYFGGGTPSFLSNAQLERMIERINQNWTWDAAKEVTFECEPGTLKQSKLQTIKKIGVTRLSLGVEHFDDEILSTNGRAHKSLEIFRAYEWIRETGFQQVNIDLIAGMLGETDDKWKMAVQKAIELDADSVTIYQMEVPFNTRIAKETKEHGDAETPIASWAQKRAWVDYAFKQFEAHGYKVSSAYTLVKASTHAGFVYRDSLWRGADLVGTGVASFGHFQGVHYQNLDKWEDYIAALDRGELPIHRALPVTDHQRLIREMILLLKTGHLDAAYFREKFDTEIIDEFDEAWSSLVGDGFAQINGDEVRLTREGLLRVDSLLPRFFEAEYRGIRYT